MEEIERKTIGELLDELSVTNIKIYHLVDRGYAGDGEAAVQAQRLNQRRSMLMRALNGRLEPDQPQLPTKVYSNEG